MEKRGLMGDDYQNSFKLKKWKERKVRKKKSKKSLLR
jgi:hypothetical protein